MQSDIIDIGQLVAPDGIARQFNLNQLWFESRTIAVPNTKVDFEYRLGSTLEYNLDTWTDWRSGFDSALSSFRYLQW